MIWNTTRSLTHSRQQFSLPICATWVCVCVFRFVCADWWSCTVCSSGSGGLLMCLSLTERDYGLPRSLITISMAAFARTCSHGLVYHKHAQMHAHTSMPSCKRRTHKHINLSTHRQSSCDSYWPPTCPQPNLIRVLLASGPVLLRDALWLSEEDKAFKRIIDV